MGQIEDLKLFASIVEQKGVSRAAEKLNIAKSAVSRRLSLLEERFETTLIDRLSGTWQLTDAGNELYQRATQLIGDMEDLEADFGSSNQSIEGPLFISVSQEFGHTLLKQPLLEFARKYPQIQL